MSNFLVKENNNTKILANIEYEMLQALFGHSCQQINVKCSTLLLNLQYYYIITLCVSNTFGNSAKNSVNS